MKSPITQGESFGRRVSLNLLVSVLATSVCLFSMVGVALANDRGERDNLERAKVFLAAADYRRALEACLDEVWEAPSAESYTYLTYVYHTIDGYLEHLAKTDRWVAVEHLYLNLGARGADDVVDPPDVLARMAKEIMQLGVRKQSDISAAMANRLDRKKVDRLWMQQTAWRAAQPTDWWTGVPEEWNW